MGLTEKLWSSLTNSNSKWHTKNITSGFVLLYLRSPPSLPLNNKIYKNWVYLFQSNRPKEDHINVKILTILICANAYKLLSLLMGITTVHLVIIN